MSYQERRTTMTLKRIMSGLYEGDGVRTERLTAALGGKWRTEVMLRRIGETRYWEFSPHGAWVRVGDFKTLKGASDVKEMLESGNYLFTFVSAEASPWSSIVTWANVKDEIAAHPSVRPG
jgi:hypothetical protein